MLTNKPGSVKKRTIKLESLHDLRGIAAAGQCQLHQSRVVLITSGPDSGFGDNFSEVAPHMVIGGRFPLVLLITAVNVAFATEWSYNKGR